MTQDRDRMLGAEFRLFARHIAQVAATPYQESKYLAAHRRYSLEADSGFEKWLLGVARSGRTGVWLADAYSGFLARKSVVRSKLVLTLALLECAAPSFVEIDRPDGGRALFSMALRGLEGAVGLVLGALIFAPPHLWSTATAKRR